MSPVPGHARLRALGVPGEHQVEEFQMFLGRRDEVAALVQHQAFDYLDAPVERVGAKFAPIPFAPVMEEFVVPHAEDVLAAVKRTVGKD